jgi:hypothetical protein
MLRVYLVRHHVCDENLKQCYNELEEMSYGDLVAMLHYHGQMAKWMLEKGKEKGCRFVRLDLPKREYKAI